jgi:hypothetical protein
MPSHRKTTIARIENSLSDVLRGTSVQNWAERTAFELLQESGENGPPVTLELSTRLLQTRKIKDIKYILGLPENGRLSIGQEGFSIELARNVKFSLGWLRLTLAHEFAHSLFYDIQEWPPSPLVSTMPGDRDLEWLCWQVAKTLLVPQAWLREHIEKSPAFSSPDFSLAVLYELEKTFSVPWKVIAQRLVEDLKLWNVVILHFVKGDELEGRSDNWYLKWHTAPLEGTEMLFIPFGGRREGTVKLPQAKGNLLEFISSCAERGKEEVVFRTSIPYEALNTSTTGNLGKFLRGQYENRDVFVDCALRSHLQYQMFGKEIQPTSSSLIMSFVLPYADVQTPVQSCN